MEGLIGSGRKKSREKLREKSREEPRKSGREFMRHGQIWKYWGSSLGFVRVLANLDDLGFVPACAGRLSPTTARGGGGRGKGEGGRGEGGSTLHLRVVE
jgi:hypothetical protein